jgi:predicted secreted protein
MEIIFDDQEGAEVNSSLDPNTDTVITADFFPDSAVIATKFTGTIIVTEYAVTASYDGLVTASVSFSGTGALAAYR